VTATSFPPGPYKTVQVSESGDTAPWYIIPFDKIGACTAPLTRNELIRSLKEQNYTDIFVFSHGWNNDWKTATDRYENFVSGFLRMRAQYHLPARPHYKPLLIGIFWPSTALVMPWEAAPTFAASESREEELESRRREIEELGAEITEGERQDFYGLTQKPLLDENDAKRLAEIIAAAIKKFDHADHEIAAKNDSPSANELLARTRRAAAASRSTTIGDFGFAIPTGDMPQAAFDLTSLDPRNLVRIATVLQMKDRAGRVGAIGVGQLLRDVLSDSEGADVHLIGHSYGAIVVLSALCYSPDRHLPRAVQSVLLLQPAVSHWCFATNVNGEGFPSGYRVALDRVRSPILATFSRCDVPLTKFFHLAVRRDRDLGQAQIAGANLPQAPSPYAALGGFGPAGLSETELQVVDLASPTKRLELRDPLPKVAALNGDAVIGGHGDISVPATWWALFQQIRVS